MPNIKVSCLKQNLKRVRQFVSDTLESYPVNASDVNLMVLAVDELCANLIIHSHDCNPNECIEVSVRKNEMTFVFEIKDTAQFPPFDIASYQTPELQQVVSERRSGGIGLILVKKIADEIHFEREGNHNICRISKSFSPDTVNPSASQA